MAREMAVIKGAEVKSVHVGESWITVTIRIPLKTVSSVGAERNAKPVKHRARTAQNAWETIRKNRAVD